MECTAGDARSSPGSAVETKQR
jgi:hypothetical protein